MAAAPAVRALALLGWLLAAPAAAQQAQPTIVGVGISGCIEFGERITVRGGGLGRAAGRALMLRDPNIAVELPVSSWTDRAIVATLPKHRQLTAGNWYVLGIQDRRSGQWLTGRGRPLQICPGETQPPGSAQLRATPPSPPDPDSAAPRPPERHRPAPPAPGAERPQPPAPPPPGAVPPPVPPAATPADPDREPDEVLATTATLADATALAQQAAGLGYTVRALQELPALGFALLRLGIPAGLDVPAALDALRQAFPAVLFDANALYEPEAAATGAAEPRRYAKALIGWPEPAPHCGTGAAIGLIDTAVDDAHAALADRSVTRRSFLAAGVAPAPPDHGTAVAALLIGAPDSTATGLLPAARLHAAAIFALRDERVVGTTDAIARAVDWLGQEGVRLVNLSLAGPGNQIMRLTVERALAGGMVLVAAAGNEGPNAAPVFPAAYPPVIAVTAVDVALQPYGQANRGGYIDLAAPGVDVWSARRGNSGRYNTGTSFAAPFVTAAAAVALARSPDAAPDAVRRQLQQAARDLGTPGRDDTFGWGLLQLAGGC